MSGGLTRTLTARFVAEDRASKVVTEVADSIDKTGKKAESAGSRIKSGFGSKIDDLTRSVPGASSAMDTLGLDFAGMGPKTAIAAGGIGLVAAAAFKGVSDFRDLARETEGLKAATGQSADEASRWISVFKPLGVEVQDLQDVFNNVAQKVAEGDEVFDRLGVTIARGKNGRVDMNETMLRIGDALSGIKDPAEKAAIASELFGEQGSRQFATLIDSAGELRDKYDAVSEGLRMDEGDLADAKELDASMRELNMALKEVSVTFGKALIPALNNLADAAGFAMDAIDLIPGGMDTVGKAFSLAVSPVTLFAGAIDKVGDVMRDDVEGVMAPAVTRTGELASAMDGAAVTVADLDRAFRDTTPDVDELAEGMADARDRTDEFEAKWRSLMDALNQEEALRSVKEQFDEVGVAAFMAYATALDGSEDAKAKAWEYQGAVIDTKQAVLDYAASLGTIPDEEMTRILAQIDQGKYQEAWNRLEFLSNPRIVWFEARSRGTIFGQVQMLAAGGVATGPTPALIAEAGRSEAVIPLDANGLPPAWNRASDRGRGTTVNIDARGAVGLDQNALARAVSDAVKRAQRIGVR